MEDGKPVCFLCPVGAMCGNGLCMLEGNNTDLCEEDGSRPEGGANWTQVEGVDQGRYTLIECEEGYVMVTEPSGLEGCFGCDTEAEYRINDENGCQVCPPGLECNGNSVFKPVVNESKWVVQVHIYRLVSCPSGYLLYAGEDGAFDATVQECIACGPGRECTNESCTSAQCSPCQPGHYKTAADSSPCLQCPVDTFRTGTAGDSCESCTVCPEHSSTRGAPGAVSEDACVCDDGFYKTKIGGLQSCVLCPVGALCPDEICVFEGNSSELCANDYSIPGGAVWTQTEGAGEGIYTLQSCAQGYVIRTEPEGMEGCFPCDTEGEYYVEQLIINSTSDSATGGCKTCPPGLVCSGNENVTKVIEDSKWSAVGDTLILESCPTHYYVYSGEGEGFDALSGEGGVLQPELQECVPCGAGYECKSEACVTCTPCSAGYYKGAAGAWECKPCPADTYLNASGAYDVGECIPCPPGSTTVREDGKTSVDACVCGDKQYMVVVDGNPTQCSKCPIGALCGDLTCALADFVGPEPTCADNTVLYGNWTKLSNGTFKLLTCPDDMEERDEPHDLQACTRCTRNEYYIKDLKECRECQPSLECRGDEVVVEKVNGSAVVLNEDYNYNLTFCPQGYFRSVEDEECLLCGTGQDCKVGGCTDVCADCLAGTYKASIGSFDCLDCPSNTYGPETGATSLERCLACPANSYNEPGEDALESCVCIDTMYPIWQNGSFLGCSNCPVGALCADSTCALANESLLCGGEEYVVGEWVKNETTGLFDLVECKPLEGYQIENEVHDEQQCIKCKPDEYIIDEAVDKCQECPPFLECNGSTVVDVAVVGSNVSTTGYGTYTLIYCPDGYSLQKTEYGDECIACPPGYECPDGGCADDACTACEPGKYKSGHGTSGCAVCPINTYSNLVGADSSDDCTSCPPGTATLGVQGATSIEQCECITGYYWEEVCHGCPIGAMCPDGSCTLSGEVAPYNTCADGNTTLRGEWVKDAVGAEFTLVTCPDGFELRSKSNDYSFDLQECFECSSDEYILDQTYTCNECPRGLVCLDGHDEYEIITEGATWVAVNGLLTLTSCPEGYITVSVNNGNEDALQECVLCPAGADCHCPEGQPNCAKECTTTSGCDACTAGKYKDFVGFDECKECPLNTYSSAVGATSIDTCLACPAFSNTTGWGPDDISDCVCEDMYYRAVAADGSVTCVECPTGALCERNYYCSLRDFPNPECEGEPIVGEWVRDTETGIITLDSCPLGYSTKAEECVKCLTCADKGHEVEWCHDAQYILEPRFNNSCEFCPVGALCNGTGFQSVADEFGTSLDDMGAVWVDDGEGKNWLKSCPIGWRLINTTGYLNQECDRCPEGMYIARSDDPNMECQICPEEHYCPNGGPPIRLFSVTAQIYLRGLNISQMDSIEDSELQSFFIALSKGSGAAYDFIDLYQTCNVGEDHVYNNIPTRDLIFLIDPDYRVSRNTVRLYNNIPTRDLIFLIDPDYRVSRNTVRLYNNIPTRDLIFLIDPDYRVSRNTVRLYYNNSGNRSVATALPFDWDAVG